MGNVWANIEVDHRTAAVYGGGGAVWNFGLDEVFLIFVVLTRVDEKVRGNDIENVRTYVKHL